MHRMIEWGMVQTKDQKAKMVIEECGEEAALNKL
jgi:hypothetical protein